MSKAALGQEAKRKTPKKPCLSVKPIVHIFILLSGSVAPFASSISCAKASSVLPASLAVFVTK